MNESSRLIYSTNGSNVCEECNKQLKKCRCSEVQFNENSKSIPNIYFEKQGRKGSGVTVITGLTLNKDELKILATNLKKYCDVGGSVKHNKQLELQGDQRKQVKTFLNRIL